MLGIVEYEAIKWRNTDFVIEVSYFSYAKKYFYNQLYAAEDKATYE
jgi:hypothetical protein